MKQVTPLHYTFCPYCGNKLGKKVFEGKEHLFCEQDNWIYFPHMALSATGVIVKEGKMLMVQRAREPYKGTWMFPSGYVSYGELPEEALIREVKEETGLSVLSAIYMQTMLSVDDIREPSHVILFYRVEVGEGELMPEDTEENTAIDWFPIATPPEIGWITHKAIMRKLQNEAKGQ